MEDEWEVFEEIMENGAGALADYFMETLVLQVPGAPNGEFQMHDKVF